MTRALTVAGAAEIATGLALLAAPALVGRALFGADFGGSALLAARFAGLALLGLGLACWPGPPRTGMLAYGAGACLYLAWLGLGGGTAGPLLWPAVAAHALLTLALLLDRG